MTPVDTPVVDTPPTCSHKASWINQWAKPSLKSITALCLAVLFGGRFILGAVVAAVVFRTIPMSPAATAMTAVFSRFDGLAVVLTSVVIVLSSILAYLKYGRPSHSPAMIRWSKASLVALLLVNVGVMQWVEHTMVLPKMQQYQQQGVQRGVGKEGKAFDAMHRNAEGLFKAHAVAEAILLVVTIL